MNYLRTILLLLTISSIMHGMEREEPLVAADSGDESWHMMSGLPKNLIEGVHTISLDDGYGATPQITKEEGLQPVKPRVIDAYRKKIGAPTRVNFKEDVELKRQSHEVLESHAYKLMMALGSKTKSQENEVQREQNVLLNTLAFYLLENLNLHDELDPANARINKKIITILERCGRLQPLLESLNKG